MNKTIDFHAHILPGCDHGSDSMETSLRQIAMASMAGVDLICATPHYYPERESVDSFLERRTRTGQKLREHLGSRAPQIRLGAEVLAFPGIERMEQLEALCLENTRCLLLEMPFYRWNTSLVDSVERLQDSDRVKVILAHADRYAQEDVELLLQMEIPIQLNVGNACRHFGVRHLKRWMEEGCVVAFGSDIHGTDVGYRKWQRCRKHYEKYWDQIMERTCELVR